MNSNKRGAVYGFKLQSLDMVRSLLGAFLFVYLLGWMCVLLLLSGVGLFWGEGEVGMPFIVLLCVYIFLFEVGKLQNLIMILKCVIVAYC